MPKHDVLADPLSPYWRAKVEAAMALPPEKLASRIAISRLTPGYLMREMWRAGVPAAAISSACGVGSRRIIGNAFARAVRADPTLPRRGSGWRPPKDWQQRLDAIMAKDSSRLRR